MASLSFKIYEPLEYFYVHTQVLHRNIVLLSVSLWPQELCLNGHPLVLPLGQGFLQGPGDLVVEPLATSQEVAHGFPDLQRGWKLVSNLVIAPDILNDWQDAHSHLHLWYFLDSQLNAGSLGVVFPHDEGDLWAIDFVVLLSIVLLHVLLGQGSDGHGEVASVHRDR